MRLTITLCLLLTVLAGMAQVTIYPLQEKGVSPGIKCRVGEPDTSRVSIRLRCGTVPQYPPLFIVDGSPVDTSGFRNLDPSDIVSIEILKNVSDLAGYGNNIGGVVLITTKKKQQPQFTVREATKKEIIPGATLRFTSIKNKHVQMFTADVTGSVSVTGLTNNEEYEVEISSVGYKPSSVKYKHQQKTTPQEILLQKDEIICKEVVITGYKPVWRCGITRCPTTITYPDAERKNGTNHLVVYPNPVPRGNNVTIDITTAEQQAATIRILGRDGKLVWEQSVQAVKGPNRFTVNTDSRWATGVYFLQVISRSGRREKSIIIN
jgi:hypothetical protein